MQKKLMKNLLLVLVMTVLCLAVGITANALDETGQCGDNAYWNFDNETGELVISGNGEIYNYFDSSSPFENDDNIKSVIIDEGITSIGGGLFSSCPNLESVSMSNTITHIYDGAFYFCKNLTSINLSDSLTYIGNIVFAYCTSLENMIIPDSVEVIGNSAFSHCTALKNLKLSESITFIVIGTFQYCTNLESVIIPNSVTSIGMDAFTGCVSLNNVTLPKELTNIAPSAFAYCLSLEKITLPDSLTEIGDGAFSCCTALKQVTIPESIVSICEETFSFCISLKEVIISESVTYIAENAFNSCIALEKAVCLNREVLFDGDNIFYTGFEFASGITHESFAEKFKTYFLAECNLLIAEAFDYLWPDKYAEEYDKLLEEFIEYEDDFISCMEYYDEEKALSNLTLCGHIHSTTETHSIKRNIPFEGLNESKHPDTYYEEGWTYDYDSMIRYRVCTFENCDARLQEPLETTTDSDVEIIEPADPDTDFTVDVVEDYVIIEEALKNNVAGDFEIVKAFDITMKNEDGVHVQPDGTVKVKLPLDWSKDGVYKVYRVNDDGTLTDMNAYRQGSHMVFETDHFSVYVIVDESEKTDTPATPDEPQEETKDNFFSKIIDLIKSFFNLIISWFKR